jgi:hypothetical protein
LTATDLLDPSGSVVLCPFVPAGGRAMAAIVKRSSHYRVRDRDPSGHQQPDVPAEGGCRAVRPGGRGRHGPRPVDRSARCRRPARAVGRDAHGVSPDRSRPLRSRRVGATCGRTCSHASARSVSAGSPRKRSRRGSTTSSAKAWRRRRSIATTRPCAESCTPRWRRTACSPTRASASVHRRSREPR